MKRICIWSAAFFLILLSTGVRAERFQAGVAKAVITPQQYIWMSGYGNRNKPAEGKLTDLWAKVLVLEDANKIRSCLITLDLVGIDQVLSREICESIEKEVGLSRAQVAICTSHTHTGPVVGLNLAPLHYYQINEDEQQKVREYARELRTVIVGLVKKAAANLSAHDVYWGNGKCTVAVNRRNNTESKVPDTRKQNKLVGPFDHDVPVLAIRKADDHSLTCVVFGYACHATVLSFYQWSGDYPGFAQMKLEELQPGCQAMFWAGCGADQNPLPRRKVELAQAYGARLAFAVNEVLQANMKPVEPRLKVAYKEIDLPLGRLPSREEIAEDQKSKNRFVAARAKMLLRQIDSGKPLAKTYPYPIQTWLIGGDIQFIVLGGEVVVDYAVRLKSELKGTATWVSGYANDVMAYIPSRRVLREGGYEGASSMVYYGLPTIWDPALENAIVNEVHHQLKK